MEVFERVARAAVEEASAMLLATWREAKTIQHKGAVDIVTETDRAIESAILARLTERLSRSPHDRGGIGLDRSAWFVRPRDRYVWYLDPLDGTTNFAHAYPHFAVSLALGEGPDLLFAIVHDPIRDETFVGGARSRRHTQR